MSNDLLTRGRGPKRTVVHEPGLQLIEELIAEGNDYRSVAAAIGISGNTLLSLRAKDEDVADAWSRGLGKLGTEITHHLLRAARDGNITAMIFLAKARLGWREGEAAEGARTVNNTQINIQVPPPMSEDEFRHIVEGTHSALAKVVESE